MSAHTRPRPQPERPQPLSHDVVAGVRDQPPTRLEEALLEIGQRPAIDALRQHQTTPQVAEVVAQTRRVIADRLEMSVAGAAFFLPVHRVLDRVHVEHDAVGLPDRLGLSDPVADCGQEEPCPANQRGSRMKAE